LALILHLYSCIMYVISIRVEVDADKIDEFESSMKDLIKHQQIPDNPYGTLYRSTTVNNVFYYQEEWMNRNEMDKHIESGKFRILLGCIKSLGTVLESKITIIDKTTELH